MTRAVVLLAVLALAPASLSTAQDNAVNLARAPQSLERTIRVGYTAFEHPQSVMSDSGLHSIVRYLQFVSSRSQQPPWRRPIGFEVSIGNYYQVWSWLDRGVLDAAIVSPFIAYLLEQKGQTLAVLEFSEHCDAAGHQPLVAASTSTTPLDVYRTYLQRLYAIAGEHLSPADERSKIDNLLQYARLNFVAHLSSSGFVAPLLYAEDWLRRQTPQSDGPVARRFWKLYFAHARFALHHGVQTPDGQIHDIYFSYSGRSDSRLTNDAAKGKFPRWQPYSVDASQAADPDLPLCLRGSGTPPEIPNDVLVVRRSVLAELFESGSAARATLGEQLLSDRIRPLQLGSLSSGVDEPLFASDAGYGGVHWFATSLHETFRRRVDRVFSRNAVNQELKDATVRWFEHGRFEFTVDETLGLLRLDQMNSSHPRLSLVLSGGGVKSLYQTKLLDRLYGTDGKPRLLRNFDPGAPAQASSEEGPLIVNNIIGTSGGAMLALFAAQLPSPAREPPNADERETGQLTRLLQDTSSRRLFPAADIPRVISIVLLLGIVFVALSLARVFSRVLAQRSHHGIQKDCPWPVIAAELFLIVAGAIVIAGTRRQDVETARGLEGTLYALVVFLAHLTVSCVGFVRNGAPRTSSERTLARLSQIGFVFGVTAVASAFAVFYLSNAIDIAHQEVGAWAPPLMGIAGICVIGFSIFTAADARLAGLYLHRERFRDYRAAVAVTVLVVLASYVIVLAGSLTGRTTTLELTGSFWYWLAGAGIVSSATVILIATTRSHHPIPVFVRNGVGELMRDRKGAVTTTLSGSMTAVATLAVVCWSGIVAPAIYGNTHARQALEAAQTDLSGSPDRGLFKSSLIVTGALLREESGCPGGTVRPGGMYFCFGGPGGCSAATHGGWQAFDMPVPGRALDAVFASGSPFPVFSPHRTHLPNGCAVPLVDGGYAHNVPLEAAMLTDTRQVLTVHASPNEADVEILSTVKASGMRWWPRGSQLVQFASRIADFMFSRAQDLDRNAGSRMMVASLSPQPEGAWASLLDFTKPTRDWMVGEATADLDQQRRIGRVESWGFPAVTVRLHPDDRQIHPRGWTSDVAAVLDSVVAGASAGTIAAFDMDNTILRGDIGDAMFLKMIVGLGYAGDDPRFWKLFPNQRAAGALREYWNRFRKQKGVAGKYLEPESWTPEFADYVVLFYRQYEELYNAPGGDGARQAYAWVARLLAGLPEERTNQLIAELWQEEMDRPTTPVRIHSASYGDIETAGGIRVHHELKQLIEELQAQRAQVWIVTASSEVLGRYVAGRLNVPPRRVLGMRLDPSNPFGPLASPVTYREGKVEALRRERLRPTVAIGDSSTDIEMLNSAATAILIDRGRVKAADMNKRWKRQPVELLRTTTVK